MTAWFQSVKKSLTCCFVVPAYWWVDVLVMADGQHAEYSILQGCIMAVGVAVSNAVLLISNAEQVRLASTDPAGAGVQAAANRLRPSS